MRSQTKLLAVILLVLALGFTGCGKKRGDSSAELDNIAEADTAQVDSSAPAAEATTADVAVPQPDDAKPADTTQAQTPSADPTPPMTTPPPETPVAAAAPAAAATASATAGEDGTYTVQKGDTLMKIAFNLYGDISQWKAIYDQNKDTLKKASQLDSGMTLKYKKPETEAKIEHNGDPYMIKKGQTLASIADDIYAKRNKWKKLWENNRQLIKDPNKIYAGFYLYYQITEEEKAQAEKIRAKRGQQLGDSAPSGNAPTDASAAAPGTATPSSGAVQPDAASALKGASNTKRAGGGLGALMRAPASVPTQPSR